MIKFGSLSSAFALSLVVLTGCGGSGGDSPTGSGLSSVTVMGDSLSDSGVFGGVPAPDGLGAGRIFSVQASPGVPTQLWTERLATLVGAPQLCHYFQFTGLAFTTQSACGSFAVGDGRINDRYRFADPLHPAPSELPFSIPYQLATAASLGDYSSSSLVLIDGGGNDAADLVEAFLGAASDQGAAFAGIVTATSTPVPAIGAALANADLASAGVLYMQTLADELYGSIQANVLNKKATHVAILNIPAITKTPKFQMVLAGVEQATDATTRASYEDLFTAWIQAFNARLAVNAAGDRRVAVVDFYSTFLDQIAHPAQYGLSNVTTPACPPAGVDAAGLPTYDFGTCTAASLSAEAGHASPDWWKTYAFSDGFHPTPYGHQLMAQSVSRSLARAGWIQ